MIALPVVNAAVAFAFALVSRKNVTPYTARKGKEDIRLPDRIFLR